jgi:hypothetical protein
MKLYFLANYIHLFKAICYVIWLNVLLQLVNFVIEIYTLKHDFNLVLIKHTVLT